MSQSHPRGFTVVETLVAASVVLVGLLAIAGMFPTASFNVDQGGRMSRAVALAQGALEAVKNSPFPPASGTCSGTTAPDGSSTVPAGYTCSQTVNVPVNPSAPNRLATVTVAVGWTARLRGGTVSLATRLSE